MVTTVAVVNDNCCYCLDVSLSLVLKIVDRNVCVICASMLLRVLPGTTVCRPAKAIKGTNPDETIRNFGLYYFVSPGWSKKSLE
mmetsp:Transcript_23673/g.26562  ORF Transcript_23673/g.26562 Transcript_23673/m.26562 type:complete len:84 (-) Transcript_23673:16-267(-)